MPTQTNSGQQSSFGGLGSITQTANNFYNALTGNWNGNRGSDQSEPEYYQTDYNYGYQGSSSTSCDAYWSYQNDYYGKFGFLSIPNPDYRKSVVKVVLSVAARLNSVRF